MFDKVSEQQDFTAGECWGISTDLTPATRPAEGGIQWQLAFFLGSLWGNKDPPVHTDSFLVDYVRKVVGGGGVVTIDAGFHFDGSVYKPHLDQLIALRDALKGTAYAGDPPAGPEPRGAPLSQWRQGGGGSLKFYGEAGDVRIEIVNLTGRTVGSIPRGMDSGAASPVRLPCRGVYVVKATGAQRMSSKRIVVY